MAIVERSKTRLAAPGAPRFTRDPVMRTDFEDGVRWIADFGFPWCYDGTTPVPNAAVIRDISEHEDGKFVVASASPIVITSNGADFSGTTKRRTYIEAPASVSDAIYDNNQDFLICLYATFPPDADWPATSTALPFLSFADTFGSWADGTELATIGFATHTGLKQIYSFRQTGANLYVTVDLPTAGVNAIVGQFGQVAIWRNAAGFGISSKTVAGGRFTAIGARGIDNPLDFSGFKCKIGIPVAGWLDTLNALQLKANNFIIHRTFIEALGISERDPLAVLDDDWNRVVARNVFA